MTVISLVTLLDQEVVLHSTEHPGVLHHKASSMALSILREEMERTSKFAAESPLSDTGIVLTAIAITEARLLLAFSSNPVFSMLTPALNWDSRGEFVLRISFSEGTYVPTTGSMTVQ